MVDSNGWFDTWPWKTEKRFPPTRKIFSESGFNSRLWMVSNFGDGLKIRDYSQSPSLAILGFHMTSRLPCWCPQTMKWRPCWCPDPILRELKAIIMLTSSFVFVEKHGCWSREWNPSIAIFLVYKHWRHISFDIQIWQTRNKSHCLSSN